MATSVGGRASMQTLLLNATHEPLAVLAARRALTLVLAGKAECLVERDSVRMRSPTVSLSVPAVLRLHRYVHVPHAALLPVSRAGILRRDGRHCAYCRGAADTIDHIIPRSRGGTHTWENCVACCSRCNSRKADHLLGELGWKLPFSPNAPRRVGTGRVWLADDADPAWRPWLWYAA